MWIQLTAESLLTRVSSNEQARLNRAKAVPTDQDNVLGEIAQVKKSASDWRSGLGKVTTCRHTDRLRTG